MSYEIGDGISEGMSSCCSAAVWNPGDNTVGQCEDCHDYCGIITDEQAECMGIDEHMKRIISEGGNDVCFNCGGTE